MIFCTEIEVPPPPPSPASHQDYSAAAAAAPCWAFSWGQWGGWTGQCEADCKMRRHRTCLHCSGTPADIQDCQSVVGLGNEDWTKCLSCP